MDESLAFLQNTPLFRGLPIELTGRLLQTLTARRGYYAAGETILRAGETISSFGVLLSGSARIEREDYDGNREIVGSLRAGELFGEVFACLGDVPVQVTVVAAEPCDVLFLRTEGLFAPEFSPVLHRFLHILARKNLALTEKLRHMSHRSTRQKLLSFLDAERRRAGSDLVEVRFDRQQLADYLSIDRSAMCRELSKMKAEGLIDYDRKTFRLLTDSD